MKIKECVKNVFFTTLTVLIKIIRIFTPKKYQGIVPSAGPGSVGDDAMVRALVRHTRIDGFLPVIIGGKEGNGWNYIEQIHKTVSLNSHSFSNLFNLLICITLTKRLYIIGADIMDGHYNQQTILKRLDLSKLFTMSGIEVRFTGFSFNQTPKKQIVKALNENVANRYFLRDSFSLKRFKDATDDLNIYPSADLAFLTEQTSQPNKNVRKISDWVLDRHNNKNKVIVVNINWLPFRTLNKPTNEIIERYRDIILKLHSSSKGNLSFLIVPHDYRKLDNKGDVVLGAMLFDALANILRENIMFADFKFNSEELSYFISNTDFVITGRMHLAIIASTNNIASFSFAYQDKFLGFYEILGLESETLMSEPENIFSEKTIQNISESIRNSESLNETIKRHRNKIIQLSKLNFR